jgi:hypothetical protein
MIQLGARDYDELCRSPAVREQTASLEAHRKSALLKFWLLSAGGTLVGVAAWWTLSESGWGTFALVAGFLFLAVGVITGLIPLQAVARDIKYPVLQAVAGKAGMEYESAGFAPPLYPDARKALFGTWLSSETFSDLFHGADEAGNGYAVYEGHLQRSSGKSRHTVFLGQIYAFQRRCNGEATTVVVPDRGLFNFFKPAGGMDRVKVDYDPEFEKKFEVYSTHEVEAKQLLFDSNLRRRLLELRQAGKVLVYIGPEGALVAATGRDRFEPGSMFRSKGGDERVRSMFDDFCASMAVLRDLKERLG